MISVTILMFSFTIRVAQHDHDNVVHFVIEIILQVERVFSKILIDRREEEKGKTER